MRRRCAYLTMADPGDYVTDYDLSYASMAAKGWQTETCLLYTSDAADESSSV